MGKLIKLGLDKDVFRDNQDVKDALLSGVGLAGLVTCEHFRDGKLLHTQTGKNIFTTVGLNHMLDCVLAQASQVPDWYVGIFKGNVTPVLGDTSGAQLGAAGTYLECQDADYDLPPTNKPTYDEAAASAGVMTNSANKAAFTIADAANITVYGAFLSQNAAKAATTGVLLCAKKFTTPRAVVGNDVLNVTYQITASSS